MEKRWGRVMILGDWVHSFSRMDSIQWHSDSMLWLRVVSIRLDSKAFFVVLLPLFVLIIVVVLNVFIVLFILWLAAIKCFNKKPIDWLIDWWLDRLLDYLIDLYSLPAASSLLFLIHFRVRSFSMANNRPQSKKGLIKSNAKKGTTTMEEFY